MAEYFVFLRWYYGRLSRPKTLNIVETTLFYLSRIFINALENHNDTVRSIVKENDFDAPEYTNPIYRENCNWISIYHDVDHVYSDIISKLIKNGEYESAFFVASFYEFYSLDIKQYSDRINDEDFQYMQKQVIDRVCHYKYKILSKVPNKEEYAFQCSIDSDYLSILNNKGILDILRNVI